MKKVTMSNLVQVPEYIIQSAALSLSDDENNSFSRVLKAAEEYKEAGMTPVFVLDKERMDIYCFAEETFGKKLH